MSGPLSLATDPVATGVFCNLCFETDINMSLWNMNQLWRTFWIYPILLNLPTACQPGKTDHPEPLTPTVFPASPAFYQKQHGFGQGLHQGFVSVQSILRTVNLRLTMAYHFTVSVLGGPGLMPSPSLEPSASHRLQASGIVKKHAQNARECRVTQYL